MSKGQRKIQIRITDDDFLTLEKKSTSLGLKPASLLKKIAVSIINGNTVSDKIKPYYSTCYNKKLSTKLNDELSKALKKEAAKNGWSLSKEMQFRLASSLVDDPSFYPDEVKELRAARNAIDMLGRNLHYIIVQKQMLTINDKNFHDDVKRLTLLIEQLKNSLEDLTTFSINRKNFRSRGKVDGDKER